MTQDRLSPPPEQRSARLAGSAADTNSDAAESAAETTLADVALSNIMGLLKRGELRCGSIVNELDLAKRFKMSRGPVREAIRRLEGRKLITREAYQRARVIDLGPKQINEIFELREGLETMACRLATQRMTDRELAQLAEQINAANEAREHENYYTTEFRFSFHVAIAKGSGNGRIQELLCTELYDLVRLYRWSSGAPPGRSGGANQEHWQICRAMLARDEDLAASLMHTHIQRARQLLD
jgi:DNA-binding GntR family transcriptional regulator